MYPGLCLDVHDKRSSDTCRHLVLEHSDIPSFVLYIVYSACYHEQLSNCCYIQSIPTHRGASRLPGQTWYQQGELSVQLFRVPGVLLLHVCLLLLHVDTVGVPKHPCKWYKRYLLLLHQLDGVCLLVLYQDTIHNQILT